MPILKSFDHIFESKDSLLNADWEELKELQQKYPYSNYISVALAKKQFLENNNLNNSFTEKAIFLGNNPALLLNTLKEWKTTDTSNHHSKPASETSTANQVSNQNIADMKDDDKKYKYGDSGITNDFTKWIISKDAALKGNIEAYIDDEAVKAKESTQLKDEIVSESLAEIYAMQGLKKEAIEMYKKLSLKNPIKSTYFAELIENLKK